MAYISKEFDYLDYFSLSLSKQMQILFQMTSPIIKQPRAVICALGVYSMEYSRIRIKSTPRDRKKLLTLRKVDFIQFHRRKPKFY